MLKADIAMRVVADHVRAIAFSIVDGQLPSNTGAGYVIRRILRRASRYGFTFLDQKEPFIYKLIKVLDEQMGYFFDGLRKQKDLIEKVIHEEEASFLRTLEQGLKRLDQYLEESKSNELSGDKVFELYDTYGFPTDLTELILRERGMEMNRAEYEAELNRPAYPPPVRAGLGSGCLGQLAEPVELAGLDVGNGGGAAKTGAALIAPVQYGIDCRQR